MKGRSQKNEKRNTKSRCQSESGKVKKLNRRRAPWVQGRNEVNDACQGRRWKGETKKDWKMSEKEIKKMEEGRESPRHKARK